MAVIPQLLAVIKEFSFPIDFRFIVHGHKSNNIHFKKSINCCQGCEDVRKRGRGRGRGKSMVAPPSVANNSSMGSNGAPVITSRTEPPPTFPVWNN